MKRAKFLFLFFLLIVVYFVVAVQPVDAARKRVRKARGSASKTTTVARKGVGVSVRFRPDRRGLLLTFSNFDNIASGSYELVYSANGVTQGAGGVITVGDGSTKELLFATCSHGVCVYHKNITNARLSIISKLKNGQTVLKPFRIKI